MEHSNRLKFLRITICLGLLVGIICSFELWFPIVRSFPRAPIAFSLPESVIVLIERLLASILIISLVSAIFFSLLRIFLITAVSSLALLIFFDQMRLQPWVYQYLLLLAVFVLLNRQTDVEADSNQTLALAQIVFAGLYFWSGIQKLNFTFSHETLPMLLAPLQNVFPSSELPFVFLGIMIALIEALIGCGLLFRRTRNLSVVLAISMHLTILGLLIALGHNSIVWIWNAALIAIVVIVFRESDASFKKLFRKAGDWRMTTAKLIIAASVLLPFFSFWGWWDMYLSGALYSGKTEVAVIQISDDLFEKLPLKAQQSVFQTKNTNQKMLPLFEWATAELNVPAYPEKRVSKQIARKICALTADKNQVQLIIKERPEILDGSHQITRITCAELKLR